MGATKVEAALNLQVKGGLRAADEREGVEPRCCGALCGALVLFFRPDGVGGDGPRGGAALDLARSW